MRALVTGCAGFIGSALVRRLLDDEVDVVGVDAFTDYYDVADKHANLPTEVRGDARFRLVEADVAEADLVDLLAGVDVVFHLAAQPGIRASWDQFDTYVHHNVTATRRLLDACERVGVARLVYASSSSVYGDATTFPTRETALPSPNSPYGVTKLAGEHLCGVDARNLGIDTVALRYFTVFGPGQRPDMAMHRLVEAALDGSSFPLYGDGAQVRDFTHVDDVVEATVLAGRCDDVEPGAVCNVAGGESASLSDVIAIVEDLVGAPVHLDRRPTHPGDVRRTGASTDRARDLLGWQPRIGLVEGLQQQVAWHRARRAPAPQSWLVGSGVAAPQTTAVHA